MSKPKTESVLRKEKPDKDDVINTNKWLISFHSWLYRLF